MRKGKRGERAADYTGAERVLAAMLALCAVAAGGTPVTYHVDPARTAATYGIVYLGVLSHRGRFAGTRGSMTIDLDAHEGRVEFTVDARSVDSGWSVRDAFIRDVSMLDADRHPAIAFVSTQLRFTEERLVRIDGRLSLRGVTRDVALDVAQFDCGVAGGAAPEACTAEVTATLHRSDFGMTALAPLIDDVVTLDFAVVARR
jgi:polyisoprenoid-binding protein YceI